MGKGKKGKRDQYENNKKRKRLRESDILALPSLTSPGQKYSQPSVKGELRVGAVSSGEHVAGVDEGAAAAPHHLRRSTCWGGKKKKQVTRMFSE